MLKNSQTKVIMPAVAFGVLRQYSATKQTIFGDTEIRRAYQEAVRFLKKHFGHDVHIGAKYEDAYGMRMSRYGFLSSLGHLKYELAATFAQHADNLCKWIPDRIKQHIDLRIGVIPTLAGASERLSLAANATKFLALIEEQLALNPTSFEIVSFAVIKVHLEKFACRIYRDTRTSAHDRGVDLATNFGVVYQVKKLRVLNRSDADKLYADLKLNFDSERLQDGNVILVIDDISEEVRRYLVNMKVQSIKKDQLVAIARGFDEPEDRQKVLRVIYDEFRRDYSGPVR
ncbi:MAG: hypothetical protein KIS67_10735 [Verrucomicrobiae bacterium]|nr:hypothetical protein [Verrucomicrobiae bacterium]